MKQSLQKKIDLLICEKRKYELDQKVSFWEKVQLFFDVPIQKIIGYIEMANVKIKVNKKVLIPRYETEELIYEAIKIIQKNQCKNILDLCCGSGFIGIAIKNEFQNSVNVVQSDISNAAIKQTKINAKLNNVQTKIIKSNMFENIDEKFDLLVSNPPYLIESERKSMDKSVLKYEPKIALFAKNDGLYFYKVIEKNLKKIMNKNSFVILEINPINAFWFEKNGYKIIQDINKKNRFALKQIN